MLTLINFDIKNTWSKILFYCGVIAVFTAATIYLWSNSFEGFFTEDNFYWITICKLGSLGVTGAVCLICLVMTFITLSQWFSQSLLAEEGHFINMLPVSKVKLFTAKTITAFIWNFFITGFILACIIVFLGFGDKLNQINDVVIDLMGGTGEAVHIIELLLIGGLFIAMYCTCVSILGYGAICVGQLVNLGRSPVILLSFLGIGLAQLIVGVFIGYLIGAFNIGDLTSISAMCSFYTSFCYKLSAVSLLNCLISFGLGSWILSSHLNLD